MSWIPLHVHSHYSILSALGEPKALIKKAKEYQLPALALTDQGNVFAAVDFYKACKAEGIKPILGCHIYLAPSSCLEKTRLPGKRAAYHLVLLAKDIEGYRNLCKLSSIGYREGFYYFPRIDKELLQQYHQGLICLSGGAAGFIADKALNESEETFFEEVQWFKALFADDFYFELQRSYMSESAIQQDAMAKESWLIEKYESYIAQEEKLNGLSLKASKQFDIKTVACNEICYLNREDWKAHEILMNVQSGEPCEIWEKDSLGNLKSRIPNPKRRTLASHECYFKSPQEIEALFSDIPQAIETTVEISDKCSVILDFDTKYYPVFVPPSLEKSVDYSEEERVKASVSFLMQLCEDGIKKRYTQDRLDKVKEQYPDKDPMEVIYDRLKKEMDIMVRKGMCDYILIVYDFINWAKNNHIPVGPGRGSGAGSIILYLTEITDIEPLRFNLFFERFINPERLSYPDIDVDICMALRNEVIEYTLNKYGKDNVAQIITFGTMKAKMTIKDVGRVLSVPLAKVNQIAKLVPEELNITLDKALEMDAELRQMVSSDEDAHRILELGKKLEGSVRSTGIHAAGVVVCGDELTQRIPICRSKDTDMAVTQYAMKPLEAVGMLKMDFLGLKTLTCIQKAVQAVERNVGTLIDWVNLPLEDANTFKLLNQGKTLGVFQLESSGMADLATKLHIDKFEEIIAAIALYRPGPMSMIPSFINRKHGTEAIESEHPWMEDILKETYGVMVYQEQVMQIASKLADFSLGEGDVLRRAMGKKDMQEMSTQREKFKTGAEKNGISGDIATQIFDKMERFAAYGFNKSHAAAYAYLSYATAYFKANYPGEWMAALMTCDRDDISKVAKFIRECQVMGIAILPPDVNEAWGEFAATKAGIRFAMTAIKGVGGGVVEAIIAEREKNGVFSSLYDFILRISAKKVGKKVIECLVDAGCFDFTNWSRDALRVSIEPVFQAVSKDQKEKEAGFMSLFSLLDEGIDKRFLKEPVVENPTLKNQLLLREKELLGFFLTGHPMDHYQKEMKALACISLSEVESMDVDTFFRTSFLIETLKVRASASTQRKFAFLTISDGMERFEVPIWSNLYEEKSHLLNENQLLCAILQVEERDGVRKLACHWLEDLEKIDQRLIHECDQVYDRLKFSFKKGRYRRSMQKSNNTQKPQVKEKKEASLKMVLNADKLKLSHVLELKQLFRSHGGEVPIEIEFIGQESVIGKLHISKQLGVKPNPTLLQALEKLSGFVSLQSL